MSYVPIWDGMLLSSLWEEDDLVLKVFLTMLLLKDYDHVVRKSAYQIARAALKTEEQVLWALDVLKNPDTRRKEPQEFEGRRVRKVEDGWLILNGKKYQEDMVSANRRAYKRKWEAEKRVKAKMGLNKGATAREGRAEAEYVAGDPGAIEHYSGTAVPAERPTTHDGAAFPVDPIDRHLADLGGES